MVFSLPSGYVVPKVGPVEALVTMTCKLGLFVKIPTVLEDNPITLGLAREALFRGPERTLLVVPMAGGVAKLTRVELERIVAVKEVLLTTKVPSLTCVEPL